MSCDVHNQLGFDGLLAEATETNRQREFEKQTFHLPKTMDEGIAYYRDLIDQHHQAMIAADVETVTAIREEAHLLAKAINNGEPGILANDDAPGCVLARETAAAPGSVPLWGQSGTFEIAHNSMRVRIELEGMFGIASGFSFWPGFAAHSIEPDKPFLSDTGYRSFLGIYADPMPDMLPDMFAAEVIASYVKRELKGKLRTIKPL